MSQILIIGAPIAAIVLFCVGVLIYQGWRGVDSQAWVSRTLYNASESELALAHKANKELRAEIKRAEAKLVAAEFRYLKSLMELKRDMPQEVPRCIAQVIPLHTPAFLRRQGE